MPYAIVVHGGAGTITPERHEITQEGCREAARAGWQILEGGGSALDAVEASTRALEDNPNFNAGTGSCLTQTGSIEMDAGIMEGHTLRTGAVACIEHIKNPIALARLVLESEHVMLVSKGAEQFALKHGMALCKREDLLTERQYQNWLRLHPEVAVPEEKHGTVGAVAIDQFGTLAAAASTGGIPNQYPGRVGDTPLIGCGFYADEHAAVACTGYGEDFVRLMLASRAAFHAARGMTARAAAEAAIAFLGQRATGKGGLILIDRLGNIGFAWNSANMVHAYMNESMAEPKSGL